MTTNYRAQIEESLLHAAIVCANNGKQYVIRDVIEQCKENEFITPIGKLLYGILKYMFDTGQDIDVYTVGAAIKAQGVKAKNLGFNVTSFAERIQGSLAYESSIESGIKQLKSEHAKLTVEQDMTIALNDVKTNGYSTGMIADRLEGVVKTLRDNDGKDKNVSDDWNEFFAGLELEAEQGKKIVPTPWSKLNTVLRGGVEAFELIVLAARPSVGKTAIAVNWTNSICASGGKVCFISLEVENSQIRKRIVSSMFGFEFGKFRKGVSFDDVNQIRSYSRQLEAMGLCIHDGVKYSVSDIRSIAKKQQHERGLDMVVIDYLQLMKPANSRESREQQVAQISRDLKVLTKELGVPVLLLAQLNRDSVKTNREPVLSDLRESGAIEQDADVVIMLHEKQGAPKERMPVKAFVRKGRSSGTGVAEMIFRGNIQLFEDDFEDNWKQANVGNDL